MAFVHAGRAQSSEWLGGIGDWNNPANWSNGVPSNARGGIHNNGTLQVIGTSASYGTLSSDSNGGAITITNGVFSSTGGAAFGRTGITVTSGTWTNAGAMTFNSSILDVNAGSYVSVGDLFAAAQFNNQASSVTVTGGTMTVAKATILADAGNGTFLLDGGYFASNTGGSASVGAKLGNSATFGGGQATVKSGTWSVRNNLEMSRATLTVSGGLVSVTDTILTSNVTINLSGTGSFPRGESPEVRKAWP